MTQCEAILTYLQSGGKLTPIQALQDYGCFRLAARICELRKDHFIFMERVLIKKGCWVARYWMP